MDNSIDKLRKRNIILAVVVILLPILQAGVIALFSFVKYGVALPGLKWNDEAMYYALVKTWVTQGAHKTFGFPIGYYGFNGGHALMNTGSAWNSFIILPYALFAGMFGLNYHTIYFANLTFLTLAQVIFLLIVKPDLKTKIRFAFVSLFSTPVLLYISTQMSEPLRYSLTIVLAAMIYKLFATPTDKRNKLFSYLILPLYIIFTVQIYIFFVFVIPVYIFGLLRDKKIWIRIVSTLVSLMLVGGGSYYWLHLVSSNYNIYKTERLLNALGSGDIKGVISAALGMLKEGLADLLSLTRGFALRGLIPWFVLLLAVLFLASLMVTVKSTKGSLDKALGWSGMASLVIFVGAFITMYSLDPNTFFRSNAIVALFVVYLLLLTEKKTSFFVSTAVFALGIVFVPVNLAEYGQERYLTKEVEADWDKLSDVMEENIHLGNEDEPWKSTVALYTLEPRVIAAMPAGTGINLMLNEDNIPDKVEYLMFTKHEDNLRSDWLEQSFSNIYEKNSDILDANYDILYQDEEYILMKLSK